MGSDSEVIKVTKVPDAIGTVVVDILTQINYKTLLFLMFMFIVLNSDVFVTRILSHVDGAVDSKVVTNFGTILQAVTLGCTYVLMDGLVRNEVV